MKTHTIEWNQEGRDRRQPRPPVNSGSRTEVSWVSRALAAVAVVVGILFVAAWVLTVPALFPYVQGTIWAGAFFCFTMAIRAANVRARGYLLIGSVLMVLALSSMNAAPGLAFMAVMLIAVWAAAALYRKK